MSVTRQRMSLLDSAFLRIEKRESPMHVASLQIFRIADDAEDGFVRELVNAYRVEGPLTGPFGLALAEGPLSRLAPSLVAVDVDLEYHVRHSALDELEATLDQPIPATKRRRLSKVS